MADIFSELDKTVEQENQELAIALEADKPQPNLQQHEAITTPVDAAVRVLAGPGSGKTFVLQHRYTYLLDNGVNPESIVAVTFTAKMAAELLTRISAANPTIINTNAVNQITTIHALCFRILKAEGMRLKVPQVWQQKKLITEITEKFYGIETNPGWKEIEYWITQPKNHNLTEYEDTEFYLSALGKHGQKLNNIRAQFDKDMKKKNWITFADMLYKVEQLFKNKPSVLEKYQNKFTHIIVDEGQDTSGQAMRILTAIAKPQNNFFIVGDSDQLLYRFSGATPEDNLFEGFEQRYPNGKTILLTINYRSTQTIVEACKILIDNNYASKDGPYEQKYRKEIMPLAQAKKGHAITFEMADDPEEESKNVTKTILSELAADYQPGDIFVGARTKAQLGYLEGHLVRASVPFINIAGGSFWGAKHVADVIAYIQLALREDNKKAFARIYNVAGNDMVFPWGPKKGQYCTHRWLGRAFMDLCGGDYTNAWNAVDQNGSFAAGVTDLEYMIKQIKLEIAKNIQPANVIQLILDQCYYKYLKTEEGLASTDGSENGKMVDLETIVDIAREFDTIYNFIAYVEEVQKAAKAAKDKAMGKYVVLSTIHRLKGLERKIVFGMGFSEGMESSSTGPKPSGLLPHKFSLIPPPKFGTLPTGGMGRVVDERCCAYVIVSRAQEKVYLSGVKYYKKGVFGPSRFVQELGVNHEEKT